MGYYGQSIFRGDFRLAARNRGTGGIVRRGIGFHPAMLARGDFLSDIGGVLGKVGGFIDKGLEYAPLVGKVVQGYDAAFGKAVAPTQHPALQAPQVGGGGLQLPSLRSPGIGVQVVAGKGIKGGTPNPKNVFGGGGSTRRRMNPLNVKALRRSLRRADSFLHIAKKYVKVLKPGHHVELKAHHHHKKHK